MNCRIPGIVKLFLAFGVIPLACASAPADEVQARALAMRQADAWNHHDAKAYSDLFTADADVVNVVGWWWQGRPEIERKLTAAYAWMFKDSALTITDVQVRFVTSQIAIAHVRWSMIGARPPSGIPEPRQGLQTLVMQKDDAGEWLIGALQNTETTPETAFPLGAPRRQESSQ